MVNEADARIASYLDWADRGKAGLWRYVLGFVLTILIFFLSGVGALPLRILVPDYSSSPVLNLVYILLHFVVAFFAIPLLVRVLHRRPAWSVAMPAPRFDWRDLATGFFVGVIVGLLFTGLFHITGLLPLKPNPAYVPRDLVPVAIIALVGIFIQAGSEEIVYRGYFTQLVRRFTASKVLFIGIPALLFAVPHIGNVAALGGGVLVLVPYLINGLLYAWAAYRTGSLWLALGLHLANNYTGTVFAGAEGDVLGSTAPFLIEIPGLGITTLVVFVQAVAMILALSYLLRKRPTHS